MTYDSPNDRLDLRVLAAEERPGLEARVTAAVLAYAAARPPLLELIASGIARLRWAALAAATTVVIVSASFSGRLAAGDEPAAPIPVEWFELLQSAGSGPMAMRGNG